MTIELQTPGSQLRPATQHHASQGPACALRLSYRGVEIHIHVERTPDYVFGRVDLVDGDRYCGRLSIGNPKATPDEVQHRLAALAQARVDILRSVQRNVKP